MAKWPQAKCKGSRDYLDYLTASCCARNFPQTETLHPAGKLLNSGSQCLKGFGKSQKLSRITRLFLPHA